MRFRETTAGGTPARTSSRLSSWGLALGIATLLCAGAAVFGLQRAQAAPGAYHEDEKLGYKVKYPKGWRFIAMGADEKWIAAKFLSDKSCFWTDKETGSSAEYKPVMQVITFIDDVVKKRGIETEEGEDGTTYLSFNNPYKNYQDFLKKTFSGGGWFISSEEEDELKGAGIRGAAGSRRRGCRHRRPVFRGA